jgi:hypothetical protein
MHTARRAASLLLLRAYSLQRRGNSTSFYMPVRPISVVLRSRPVMAQCCSSMHSRLLNATSRYSGLHVSVHLSRTETGEQKCISWTSVKAMHSGATSDY